MDFYINRINIDTISWIIDQYKDENNKISFLHGDAYKLLDTLKTKSGLRPYSDLIILTIFQGSLNRGITLDYPCTFLMISDVSQRAQYYLAGQNIGYNSAKPVQNTITQASLTTPSTGPIKSANSIFVQVEQAPQRLSLSGKREVP